MLNEMLLRMIKNSYNDKNIEGLETIRKFIEMIPVMYIMRGNLTGSEADELLDLIKTNIEMLEKESK